jgi:hypothetical protein
MPFFIIIFYFFVVFVLPRLVVPHLGYLPEKIPKRIPAEIEEKINELKAKSSSAEEFLKLAYDYLGTKYRSRRFGTILRFGHLFKSIDEIWQTKGFLPCTINNYLLRIFLVRSGWFKKRDIRRQHVFFNFIIHQYLRVRVSGRWLDVDVSEKQRGVPLGKHIKFFG